MNPITQTIIDTVVGIVNGMVVPTLLRILGG